MRERMHPEDLRAQVAMEFYKLYILSETDDPSHRQAILEADDFLADLARTAKQKEWPQDALERIEWWTGRCAEWQARTKKAEVERDDAVAELALSKDADYLREINALAQRRAEERDDAIISRDAYAEMRDAALARLKEAADTVHTLDIRVQELVNEKVNLEAQVRELGERGTETDREKCELARQLAYANARLAAIDAAREGEPPMPVWNPGEDASAFYGRMESWGRHLQDAAAALRVELEREHFLNAYRLDPRMSVESVSDPQDKNTWYQVYGLPEGLEAFRDHAHGDATRVIRLLAQALQDECRAQDAPPYTHSEAALAAAAPYLVEVSNGQD